MGVKIFTMTAVLISGPLIRATTVLAIGHYVMATDASPNTRIIPLWDVTFCI